MTFGYNESLISYPIIDADSTNLMAWYKFDGDFNDSSGNNNHLIVGGGTPTFSSTDYIIGQSANFLDGNNWLKTYSFNFDGGNWCFALWVKMDSSSTDNYIIMSTPNVNNHHGGLIYTYNFKYKFYLFNASLNYNNIAETAIESVFEKYVSNHWLKGVRHVVQDEPDDRFILGSDFNRGVSLLNKFNLVYDILIFERQLAASIEFVDQHPDLVFVLDHVAKPRIKDCIFDPWSAQMKDLSKRENVFCKLSGMATEANWKNWSVTDLQPYMETALECFGPNRMMFGSDWPVARLAVEYENWVEICRNFISTLSTDEQVKIEGENAVEVYKL